MVLCVALGSMTSHQIPGRNDLDVKGVKGYHY